jgi:ribosomal protein RSM22 (predicted rRNA methylase)
MDTKDLDICADCVYAADCPIRRRNPGRVQWCALKRKLRDAPEPKLRREERPGSRSAGRSFNVREEGLCATCAQREQCSRRHVEGGVWRCRDYR